jgi:acetyl esterase/lipase
MKKFIASFFILVISTMLFSSCKPSKNAVPEPLVESILNDVAYGTNAAQKMDVYLPKERNASTKTIVYIHGGGWYMGDKNEIKDGAIYFQQQGFAFISINYRLTRTPENNIHPAQILDIDKAIDFIISNSTAWSIASNKLAFWGGSAGSHLSLLYAYKYNNTKKIKAVVSTAGPTDLSDATLNSNSIAGLSIGNMIVSYIGQPKAANPQAWYDASPINFITSSSIPSLFIHGTVDSAVPYQQSVTAYQKLKSVGAVAFMEPLPNIGHGLEGINWADIIPKIMNFVNTYAQ